MQKVYLPGCHELPDHDPGILASYIDQSQSDGHSNVALREPWSKQIRPY